MILVGCVYRPPLADGGINLEISKSIGHASHLCKSDSSKHLLIAGDFNFPDIKWNQEGGYCTNKGRPSSLEFLNTLSKNFLTQHVLEPTFKSNTLDLIVTDDPGRIFSIIHGPPLGSTDKDCLHATLSWSFSLRSHFSNSPETTPRLVFRRGNYDIFSKHVLDCAKLLDSDANAAYNQLVATYSTASALAIPTCVPRAGKRPNPKWFNANIKQLTKKKFMLQCQIRSAPHNSELQELYATVCKQVKTAVRNEEIRSNASVTVAVSSTRTEAK